MSTSGALSGVRVAVTRSADRAGALADALAAAGAEPVLVPLIDFERGDQDVLGDAMKRLAAGDYAWLVISSITTVRALKQWCEKAGTTVAALIPDGTRVATIGPTSVAVLAGEGISAELAPVELQSAAGLVELWPDAPTAASAATRVLLPQSTLAEDTLREGIRAKGWELDVIAAYQTVDYPARPDMRLTAALNAAASSVQSGTAPVAVTSASQDTTHYPLLTPAEAKEELAAGVLNAVVLASGSAARRVAATMTPLPAECLVIAIGQPTREQAQRLGLHVAATASQPTPAGMVAALVHARTHSHPSSLTESI